MSDCRYSTSKTTFFYWDHLVLKCIDLGLSVRIFIICDIYFRTLFLISYSLNSYATYAFMDSDIQVHIRGFTKFTRADYMKWKTENRIASDGVNAKVCCISQIRWRSLDCIGSCNIIVTCSSFWSTCQRTHQSHFVLFVYISRLPNLLVSCICRSSKTIWNMKYNCLRYS